MNNKKRNRKGFTIVELSIVIAVIAILAAVMIPVFGNMIDKANKSNAISEAKNAYTVYVSDFNYTNVDGNLPKENLWVKTSKGYFVKIEKGSAVENSVTKSQPAATDGLVYICDCGNAVEAVVDVAASEGVPATYKWPAHTH